MLDVDNMMKDLCGFDMTSQPANNAGDPLAKKRNNLSVQEEIDTLFYENSSEKNKLLSKSEEQLRELNKTLEYFKEEQSICELTEIIKKVL